MPLIPRGGPTFPACGEGESETAHFPVVVPDSRKQERVGGCLLPQAFPGGLQFKAGQSKPPQPLSRSGSIAPGVGAKLNLGLIKFLPILKLKQLVFLMASNLKRAGGGICSSSTSTKSQRETTYIGVTA